MNVRELYFILNNTLFDKSTKLLILILETVLLCRMNQKEVTHHIDIRNHQAREYLKAK